jgi:hypothetical protein
MNHDTQAIVIALLAFLPFLVLVVRFRRRLEIRRDEYARVLGYPVGHSPRIVDRVKAFFEQTGNGGAEPSTDIGVAFNTAYSGQNPFTDFYRHYSTANYAAPLLILSVLVPTVVFLAWAAMGLGDPLNLTTTAAAFNTAPVAAAAAAVVWSLHDAVERYRSGDLTPSSLHGMWVRVLISALVAPIFVGALDASLQYAGAVAVGLFPVQTIRRSILAKIPAITEPTREEDPPSLHLLQGMTDEIQQRLRDEGIARVQHLAYRNPYQLLLRSDIEWSTIVDFVDQALLVQHVGDKIAKLRVLGVRGAIDFATLYDRVGGEQPDKAATDTALQIAKALEVDVSVVGNLGYVLWNDPVVQFLWRQWSASAPDRTGQGASHMAA